MDTNNAPFTKPENYENITVWQIVSVVLLFTTLLLTALMMVLGVLDNLFELFSHGTFMFTLFERFIVPSSLISFWFPMLFVSFAPEYVGLNIIVAVLSVSVLSVVGYFTLKIFREKAKTVVRLWLFVMIFESVVSFFFIFTDIFCVLVFTLRALTVLSLFMSLKFIDSHYEYYDY